MRPTFVTVAVLAVALSGCAGGRQTASVSRDAPSTLVGPGPVASAPSEPVEREPIQGDAIPNGAAAQSAPPPPAVASGSIGRLIGNRIGAAMDDEDKKRAYAAQMQALESGTAGAPVAWRNPDSGRYGSIVPGPAYDGQGGKCRAYTHTITIDGKPQTAKGSACRGADGSWNPVG